MKFWYWIIGVSIVKGFWKSPKSGRAIIHGFCNVSNFSGFSGSFLADVSTYSMCIQFILS